MKHPKSRHPIHLIRCGRVVRASTVMAACSLLVACSLPWESYPPIPDRQDQAAQAQLDRQAALEGPGSDWYAARDAFRDKLAEARRRSDTRSDELAMLSYEYGRTSGVLCDWVTAEDSLQEAYELDRSTDGPTHMALIELARVHLAQQQYAEARRFFEQAFPALERINADQVDPLGYVDIVEEYSAVLSRLGESTLAQEWRSQAASVRESAGDAESETEITPYGAYCR